MLGAEAAQQDGSGDCADEGDHRCREQQLVEPLDEGCASRPADARRERARRDTSDETVRGRMPGRLRQARAYVPLEQGAEPGDPDREADLAERVVRPRRHPRPGRRDGADGGRRERRVDDADTDATRDEPRQQNRPAGVGADARHQEQRGAADRQPDAEQGANRDARGQVARDRRDDERRERERQKADAGAERAVAEDVLEVQRQVEEDREHRRREGQRPDLGADEPGLR